MERMNPTGLQLPFFAKSRSPLQSLVVVVVVVDASINYNFSKVIDKANASKTIRTIAIGTTTMVGDTLDNDVDGGCATCGPRHEFDPLALGSHDQHTYQQ